MTNIIPHNHTTDKSIQQLQDTTIRHQIAINTIQATLETQQQDIADIKTAIVDIRSSINNIIHSVSEIAMKLGIEITLPPPLPLSPTPSTSLPASIIDFTTSAPSLTSAAAVAPPPPASTTAVKSSTAASLPLLKPPAPLPISDADAPSLHQSSLSIMAPSSPIKPSDSTHQILKHFSDSHIEFLFSINIGSPMKQQICLDVYFGVMPFAVLCMRQTLDPTLPKMQKQADAQDMFVEMNMLKCERKIFIFDPGGKVEFGCSFAVRFIHDDAKLTHNLHSIALIPLPLPYDLEDKVDFEAAVMIRISPNIVVQQ